MKLTKNELIEEWANELRKSYDVYVKYGCDVRVKNLYGTLIISVYLDSIQIEYEYESNALVFVGRTMSGNEDTMIRDTRGVEILMEKLGSIESPLTHDDGEWNRLWVEACEKAIKESLEEYEKLDQE